LLLDLLAPAGPDLFETQSFLSTRGIEEYACTL
jgi:hypothetical protein